MRTRFGRTLFGYVVIVGWPLSHLLALMLVYVSTRAVVPIGTNATTFFATGVLPYILFLYPSRQIMLCLVQNYPLLHFPIVKSFDIILARCLVEIITAFWVVAIFCFLLVLLGVDIIPIHSEEAIQAIYATIYLSCGMGFFGAVIYKIFKPWVMIHILATIAMYFSSGALFLPSALPDSAQYFLWFNPLLHAVEWLRSAYYDGYSYGLLSKSYLLGFATFFLLAGVVAERTMRGIVLHT